MNSITFKNYGPLDCKDVIEECTLHDDTVLHEPGEDCPDCTAEFAAAAARRAAKLFGATTLR